MKPRLSVIIPVWKEQSLINQAMAHLEFLQTAARTEIIVVDGDPRQSTLAAIRDGRIKKIPSPAGRGAQMNTGAAMAAGDILLFLHADTRLPPAAGRLILDTCRDKRMVGGAFDLTIDSRRPIFRLVEKAASLRSRLTRIPYGDQAIFLKAACFWKLGGFAPIPVMEDVDLMRRVKRDGNRIRLLADPVSTSARRWEKEGVLRATLRNYSLILLYYAGVKPETLKRYYP